jgi:hypothetical protein
MIETSLRRLPASPQLAPSTAPPADPPTASGSVHDSAGMAERLTQAQALLDRITRLARPDPATSDLAALVAYLVQLHLARMARDLTERAARAAIDSVT